MDAESAPDLALARGVTGHPQGGLWAGHVHLQSTDPGMMLCRGLWATALWKSLQPPYTYMLWSCTTVLWKPRARVQREGSLAMVVVRSASGDDHERSWMWKKWVSCSASNRKSNPPK